MLCCEADPRETPFPSVYKVEAWAKGSDPVELKEERFEFTSDVVPAHAARDSKKFDRLSRSGAKVREESRSDPDGFSDVKRLTPRPKESIDPWAVLGLGVDFVSDPVAAMVCRVVQGGRHGAKGV